MMFLLKNEMKNIKKPLFSLCDPIMLVMLNQQEENGF